MTIERTKRIKRRLCVCGGGVADCQEGSRQNKQGLSLRVLSWCNKSYSAFFSVTGIHTRAFFLHGQPQYLTCRSRVPSAIQDGSMTETQASPLSFIAQQRTWFWVVLPFALTGQGPLSYHPFRR